MEDFPEDVQRRAIVLSEHAHDVIDRLDVARRVVNRLQTWWRLRSPAEILARFRELAEGASGHAVQVQPRGLESESYGAVTRGIADDGGLIVELDDGEERILYSEDVFQLRDGDDRT
jgi:biotin-(acetyl-CoA carboxylase) ligase